MGLYDRCILNRACTIVQIWTERSMACDGDIFCYYCDFLHVGSKVTLPCNPSFAIHSGFAR